MSIGRMKSKIGLQRNVWKRLGTLKARVDARAEQIQHRKAQQQVPPISVSNIVANDNEKFYAAA